MSVSSGGSASVMEAVRQSLTAVPADAAAESNQRSLGNFGVLVVNQGGKNKSEERNNAKRTDLRTHFVQLVCFVSLNKTVYYKCKQRTFFSYFA